MYETLALTDSSAGAQLWVLGRLAVLTQYYTVCDVLCNQWNAYMGLSHRYCHHERCVIYVASRTFHAYCVSASI